MPFVASMIAPNGICWPVGSTTPFTSTVPEIGTTLKFTPATGSGRPVGGVTGGDTGGCSGGCTGGGEHARWSVTLTTRVAGVTLSGALVAPPQFAFGARRG